MSAPVLYPLEADDPLAAPLAAALGGESGRLERRRFPDGETYLRYDTNPIGKRVVLLVGLDRPDAKVLPVIFAAATARALGAEEVGLVAPYLPYMRQDRQFSPGEAVTSRHFAELISSAMDWLVTVDPHLHRYKRLAELYTVPTKTLHAAPTIAKWIAAEIPQPVLIGPDSESAQWVSSVAAIAGAPSEVLAKIRYGDHKVEVSLPDLEAWWDHTPVIVDDIVSTAGTMIQTVGHLKTLGLVAPVCIAVHGLFANSAYEDLMAAGAARVVSTNCVAHKSNKIDITAMLAGGIEACFAGEFDREN